MDRTTVAPASSNVNPAIPLSVRVLDAILNARVEDAEADGAVDYWLRVKLKVKRRLAGLPDDQIDGEAIATIATFPEMG